MALDKLDIGYIDMMLLHHPGSGDVKAYKAMEKYVEKGKIRSLGLSNWYVEELTNFLPQINITPALVQNEIHPYYQEQDVVPFIQEKGIVVQCWYPLGGRGHTSELLGDETIKSIAEAHGVSSAQVILRWDLYLIFYLRSVLSFIILEYNTPCIIKKWNKRKDYFYDN